MRASMRCVMCGTILQGGVPSCPNCTAEAAPPAAPREVRRLPLKDEFVARGYPADKYDEFIAEATKVAQAEGITIEVRPPTGEELAEYEKAVASHQAAETARLKVIAELQAQVDAEKAQAPTPPAPTAPPPAVTPAPPGRQAATRNLRAVAEKPGHKK